MDNFPIQHGTRPIARDSRDYSFRRTFGAVASGELPDSYNCDAGLTMPDQNADGYPMGCTGYTQAELCTDEDGVIYRPDFTYKKTLYMENASMGSGCDIRDALKSTIVYGVQRQDETTDAQAVAHHRGQFFNVDKTTDYFEGIRNALWSNRLSKRSVSIGTPWFQEWHATQKGIIETKFAYSGNPDDYPWHNWKISGWKTINGAPYLIGKTWQGKNYGDSGFAYFSRQTINDVMAIKGTAAFTLAQADPGNIQTVRLFTLQTILTYLYRILGLQHA